MVGEEVGIEGDGSWGETLLGWIRLAESRDKRWRWIKPRNLLPRPGDDGDAGGAVVEVVKGGRRPDVGEVGCVNIYYGLRIRGLGKEIKKGPFGSSGPWVVVWGCGRSS